MNNKDNPDLVNEPWECLQCIIVERAINFSLIHLNDEEVCSLNSVNSMKVYDMLPNQSLTKHALNSNHLTEDVLNEND